MTPATAFVISTSEQLWEITDCVSNSATVYFVLGDDIDASGSNAPTTSPIGHSTSALAYSFSGLLDGGGFAVSASMTTNAGVGLFSYLHDATISNLVIQGSFATTTPTNAPDHAAGGLAVKTDGAVNLHDITNSATVSGFRYVGGLVGYAVGALEIYSSNNAASITGRGEHIGGLLGWGSLTATINGSANTANITSTAAAGSGNAGGLAGWVAGNVAVHNSVNTGQVQTQGLYVGGIIGRAESNAHFTYVTNSGTISAPGRRYVGGVVGFVQGTVTVSESVNQAQVNGGDETGGIVGYAGGLASFTGVRNLENVTGTNSVGGLVGYVHLEAKITSSYNTGTVSGSTYVGGLVGYGKANANINSSYNTGPVSGSYAVGGLLSYAFATANITSSYNTGPVSGSGQVGGLVGFVNADANINSSHNTGIVSSVDSVGGLVGLANANANIKSSYNTGTVSGTSNYAGGLVGLVVSTANITSSYNTGPVLGSSDVGGLVGFGGANANIVSSFNTGPVSGTNRIGGLVGFGSANVNITSSYNAGTVSGTTDVDGLVGKVSGTVTTASAYSSVTSDHVASSTVANMKLASTYVGFNFTNSPETWGFGSCTDNQGFPMLRAFAQVETFYSSGCYAAPQTPAPIPVSTPTPTPVYSGSIISGAPSVVAGTEVTLTGNRLESVTTVHVGGVQVRIVSALAQSLTLDIPSSMVPGSYDLVLQSSFGTLTIQNGLTVLAPLDTGSVVEAANKKLTVVALKGFIAIYTKGYEGQRLSVKVAGKWLVVPEISEKYSGNNYSRTIRFSGASKSVKVHLYIDREFVRTEELSTR